ncbi:hypothetical protein POL68_38250 [Stigmatella sp. ncwal1]|uniref:Exo-alpha-sialidase n=1 Tax=Stigmatella ashevillensis TaxID=2995309 RepID=A0ABT5DL17_9BACT|nr:hypothetical protein [Stigmatella ashevillena]MDC0714360.1 hypothetical protein [Stigmatella ashevillena]
MPPRKAFGALFLPLGALLATLAVPALELEAGESEPDDTVSLHISGLAVPERAAAGIYLLGKLVAPGHSLRALLLRSTDGGAHWAEVLPPVDNSEVLFVHFSGCQGRALVGWTTEGPGELSLFASADCGATWKWRSKLPKAIWSEWPEQMAWKDGQHGTVWLSDTNAEQPPLRALTTRNGGRSWSSAKQPPLLAARGEEARPLGPKRMKDRERGPPRQP